MKKILKCFIQLKPTKTPHNKRRIRVYLYRKQVTSLCPTNSKHVIFYKFLNCFGVLMGWYTFSGSLTPKRYMRGRLIIYSKYWPNASRCCECMSIFFVFLSLVSVYNIIKKEINYFKSMALFLHIFVSYKNIIIAT